MIEVSKSGRPPDGRPFQSPDDPALDPIRATLRVVSGKWKLDILRALKPGALRFTEIRRAIPGITQHMLAAQLKEMEADGLLTRTAYDEVPPRVEYALTDAARALRPVGEALRAWGEAHGR